MGNIRLGASELGDDETETDASDSAATSDRKMIAVEANRLAAKKQSSDLGVDWSSSDDSEGGNAGGVNTRTFKKWGPCLSPLIVHGVDDPEIGRKKPSASSRRDPASKSNKEEEVIELLSSSTNDTETDNEKSRPPEKRKARRAKSTIYSLSSSENEWSDGSVSNDSSETLPKGKEEFAKTPRTPSQASSTARAFLRKRKALAQQLFLEFDRVVFGGALSPEGICTIHWSKRLTTTAGHCRLLPPRRTAEVTLSCKLIDRENRLRRTLMHELCHAAAWVIDGINKPPHGEAFRRWADRAERLVPSMEVSTTHNYAIQYKHSWRCTDEACGVVYRRVKRSIDVNAHRCGRCNGRLVEIAKQQGTAEGEAAPKPKAPPSAYQRFVQEQSASVRRQLEAQEAAKLALHPSALNRSGSAPGAPAPAPAGAKVSQSDVLKECARLWQAQKKDKAVEQDN
jgi:predicted SprT family Zn-dependent metalloprotease